MKFFISCLKGMALGAGAILPGISSGVLCVIFGFYEKLINSILGIFKDFKNSIKFLLPICIGGFARYITFWKCIKILIFYLSFTNEFCFYGINIWKCSYFI